MRILARPCIRFAAVCLALSVPSSARALELSVRLSDKVGPGPFDGRVLVLIAADGEREPRFQVTWGVETAQVFGVDVDDLGPRGRAVLGADTFGYPVRRLGDLPAGEYYVQAVLHRYDTFARGDGHTVVLPASWAAGQQWNREPGNLYSEPQKMTLAGDADLSVELALTHAIEPVERPEDSEYVKHVEIRSQLLSEFWGRDMFLGAHVLVPHGFEENLDERFPLFVFHGHFPDDFGGFRTQPPDPDLECEYSARFDVDCYNRIQQQEAYDFYQRWISPGFPRYLVIEIQHANPFYDDSYAVNSQNLGPYGDAITYELIPHVEKLFRGIGPAGRFLYGGSTGGWEALAAQVLYPAEYNGCFAACPDPIDFRAFLTVNLYEDGNAYYKQGPFKRMARAGRRNYLGQVDMTVEDFNHMELALGERSRSGNQFDIWEAVYSPVGDDGYPRRIFDKLGGEIDSEVAAHWRDNYDLGHILRRDWAAIGEQLAGKIHIYCGDMDNYYLNNAVYLVEEFLESTTDPYYAGEVDYGDRAEHCWNGDHENGNHLSRLRYNTMYLPKIWKRLEASAPEGLDLERWRAWAASGGAVPEGGR